MGFLSEEGQNPQVKFGEQRLIFPFQYGQCEAQAPGSKGA